MIDKLIQLITLHKQIIKYGIIGVCTTILNIVVFTILDRVLYVPLIISNVIAWIAAFIFSFYTNKCFVFGIKENGDTLSQLFKFFGTRVSTMLLDTGLMWFLVEVMNWDELFTKVLVNVIVIIINYVTSKLFVFRQGDK